VAIIATSLRLSTRDDDDDDEFANEKMRRPKTNDDDDDANASSTHHHREGKERVVVVEVVVVVADRCAARATRSTARRISSSVERVLPLCKTNEILSGEKTTQNGLLSLFSLVLHYNWLVELSRRALSLYMNLFLSRPYLSSAALNSFTHALYNPYGTATPNIAMTPNDRGVNRKDFSTTSRAWP